MAPTDFAGLWANASKRYQEISGKKLEDLPMPKTAEELISSVDKQNKDYKHFRETAGTLTTVLSAAVKPIELVGNLAAGAASMAFPPSSMVFGAAQYLINAARGVSASLNAIADLLERMRDFTVRITIYNRADLSLELQSKLTEILITVIEIFALSTKKIKDGGVVSRLKMYGKNALLGNDTAMQGLLATLEKLTVSEDRLVGAETLVEVKNTGKDVLAVKSSMADQTTMMAAMRVSADEASQGIVQIQTEVAALRVQGKEDKEQRAAEALRALLEPSLAAQDRYDQIKREQVAGSGEWILLEPPLLEWIRTDDHPILWVSGNPGCGKSFLTYNIGTHLHELAQNASIDHHHSEAVVAYFFFRDNNSQTQSFAQALRDLASQLAKADPAYAKYLIQTNQKSTDIASIRQAWKILFMDYWLQENAATTAYLLLDGLDESYPEDRATFFELLSDVRDAVPQGRLKVGMLGRPHIAMEIVDLLDTEPPTIHVDSSKNGSDILQYVKTSVAKYRALSKVSQKLKDKIIETLTTKAGGMFMWAKLMIDELNRKAQRSRESEVEKALNEAPRDLNKMLRHVLEGYSATLLPDQASDLNDMLMWVALAQRPLYLGELDAVLRLKSENGEGLIDLEGNLRKAYASLFTLGRDDGLATSDLMAPRSRRSFGEDSDGEDGDESTKNDEDGGDDLDYPTEFDSNPRTTTVALSHASISDYLRDPKQGKVQAHGEDRLAVGVDYADASLTVLKTCLDIITDDSLEERTKQTMGLRNYAIYNWFLHLSQLDRDKLNAADRTYIGARLARMLSEAKLYIIWGGIRNWRYFTAANAKLLVSFVQDEEVLKNVTIEAADFIRSIPDDNPLKIFEQNMKTSLALWLTSDYGIEWSAETVPSIVWIWLRRQQGEDFENVPTLTAEGIQMVADFAALEQNGEWHRHLAMTLRTNKLYDEALMHFEKALELDPTSWMARAGIAQMHNIREEYEKCIAIDEEILCAIEADSVRTESFKDGGRFGAHSRMATCYQFLAAAISEDITRETYNLYRRSLEHYKKAFTIRNTYYGGIIKCMAYWRQMAAASSLMDNRIARSESETALDDITSIPLPIECYQQLMDLVHDLNDTQGAKYTVLTHWFLHECEDYSYEFDDIGIAAHHTGQLEWIRARLRDAIRAAETDLQPVQAAGLSLALATLYYVYCDDETRAMRIWERIGVETNTTPGDESKIAIIRGQAQDLLSELYLWKAVEDAEHTHHWTEKLEKILAKQSGRKGASIALSESVTSSISASSLAALYTRQGRHEEARAIARSTIKEALAILGDDDPSNDSDGFADLAQILCALRDDVNVIAIMHTVRLMRKGVAVLSSDVEVVKQSEGTENSDVNGVKMNDSTEIGTKDEGVDNNDIDAADDDDDDDDDNDDNDDDDNDDNGRNEADGDDSGDVANKKGGQGTDDDGNDKNDKDNKDNGKDAENEGNGESEEEDEEEEYTDYGCDGPCERWFKNLDNVSISCDDFTYLCEDCLRLLMDDKISFRLTSKQYHFLKIPVLETRFKAGEIVVEGKVMPLEEWRMNLKKQWRL